MGRLAFAALLLATTVRSDSAEPVIMPHCVMTPVKLTDARWNGGFWKDRFETCCTETIPALAAIMEGRERSQFLVNFRIAAGMEKGVYRGPPWNDGDLYKWMEAASAVYSVTRDPALDRQLDAMIEVIAKAQRADGYLHTPVQIKNRNGDSSAKPFADRLNFEMYNFGHLFTAACVHHQATGKKTLLAVAQKAADFLVAAFKNPTPELARDSVCPAHYMGIIDMYRTTRDPRLLELAQELFDMRDRINEGTDDNQDRIPFRKQTEAVGHAVRANYLYAGAADLYAETGDRTLLRPLEKIWENVVGRKMHITGACGALFDGASPDGSKEQKTIARVHQAYGRDYQLPHSSAHNETCAAIGNILWNWRMLQISGEAKYADVMELTLYNALLAGVSLDGKRFFYTNTLRQLDTMPTALRWSRQREEWISCFCCPPNVARTVAQVHTLAYGCSKTGVWIHLFGGSTLDTVLRDGRRIKLKQETDYPWDGRVKLTIETAPESETSLFVRVPGWAEAATICVNGKPHDAKAGRYSELRRLWKSGDVVELMLPMPIRMMEAHPLVEEARNQVAIMSGPLVYCLESADLPKDKSVQNVAIPPRAKFEVRHERNLLGGIAILEGTAELRPTQPWANDLYRPLPPNESKKIDVKLIPYYTWGNRGKSEMTVWMPIGR